MVLHICVPARSHPSVMIWATLLSNKVVHLHVV